MNNRFNRYHHGIITGGSSGIGQALARLLVQGGSHVTLIGRSPEKLAQTRAQLQPLTVRDDQTILALAADVSDRPAIDQALQQSVQTLGCPDLLITSAGMAHPGYFQELDLEIFERTMAVNYFGSLYCVKAIAPQMIAQKKGTIALISSGAGLIGIFGYSAYSASKFALRGLGEALRGELKPHGVDLAVVYPPDTDTPQLQAENQIKPPECQKITASAQCLTAEQVAQEILQGLARRRFMITPGLEMSLLGRLHSAIAPVLQWQFDRIVNTVQNQP